MYVSAASSATQVLQNIPVTRSQVMLDPPLPWACNAVQSRLVQLKCPPHYPKQLFLYSGVDTWHDNILKVMSQQLASIRMHAALALLTQRK